MRKLMIAAALAVAGFLGLGAESAMAYTVNCATAMANNQSWAGGTAIYCGTAAELANVTYAMSTNAGYMVDALNQSAQAASAYSAVTAADPTFILFNTPADGTTYYTERGLTVPAFTQALGQTPRGASTGKPTGTTYIFQYNTGRTVTNGDIELTTGHEFGHWVDYYLGVQLKTTGTDRRLSSTTLFGHIATADLGTNANTKPQQNLSQHTQGTTIVNYPCVQGGGGVFNNRQGDGTTQGSEQICNGSNLVDGKPATGTASNGYGPGLNTDYSGVNATVLQAAWNDIYGSNKELFAESYVVFNNGYNDLSQNTLSIDAYLLGTIPTQKFACTQIYLQSVAQLGTIPTSQLSTAGCPTS